MKRRTEPAAILFLLPAFIIYLSVIVFPVGYTIYLSFFSGSGIQGWTFVGIDNYKSMLSDAVFAISLKNTAIWMVLTLCVTTALALLLAVALNRKFFGRTFFRSLFYMPCVISMIAVAFTWRWMYHPTMGFINQALQMIHPSLKQSWLSDPSMSLIACFVAAQWQSVGQPMILFLAGLQTIPHELIEAAHIDGASGVRCFFTVQLPLLKNTFVIVLSTLLIGSLKVYDIICGLTDGGPNGSSQVLASYMYSQTFEYNHWGYGSAIAVIMLLIMAFIVIPYVRLTTDQ